MYSTLDSNEDTGYTTPQNDEDYSWNYETTFLSGTSRLCATRQQRLFGSVLPACTSPTPRLLPALMSKDSVEDELNLPHFAQLRFYRRRQEGPNTFELAKIDWRDVRLRFIIVKVLKMMFSMALAILVLSILLLYAFHKSGLLSLSALRTPLTLLVSVLTGMDTEHSRKGVKESSEISTASINDVIEEDDGKGGKLTRVGASLVLTQQVLGYGRYIFY
jgi:hypothetical protein